MPILIIIGIIIIIALSKNNTLLDEQRRKQNDEEQNKRKEALDKRLEELKNDETMNKVTQEINRCVMDSMLWLEKAIVNDKENKKFDNEMQEKYPDLYKKWQDRDLRDLKESSLSRIRNYHSDDGQVRLAQYLSDCNDAIKADPRNAIAYSNRGGCYCKLKEYDKAWEDMHKAEELGYVNSSLLNDLKKASGRDK